MGLLLTMIPVPVLTPKISSYWLEFDALCNLEIEEIPPQLIKALREQVKVPASVG
ncbi:hypothetical protein [Desulfurivibrio alkaliphilus]|uniref:hypothetical protein n=1 Tax=Desulfurivibrio alkaliphilus TaxID=427923 RepID=UPI0001B40947|nr:hypothetical protein [Desulfurivibrio alkaliphilus]